MKKGQYFRLFVALGGDTSFKVIAAAKNMSFHASQQVEESSTKDTTGDALEYESVSKSYEITGSGLVLTPDDTLLTDGVGLDSIETYLQAGNTVNWRISLCSGNNNRVQEEEILYGEGQFTNLSIQAANKQNAEYNYTITGVGSFSVIDS